jgi:hypothetical protein
LDNFVLTLLTVLDRHAVAITQNGFLTAEVALARQMEFVVDGLDFDELGQIVHISTQLLEINGRNSDNGVELGTGNLQLAGINVKQVHLVSGIGVLVAILNPNTNVVHVVLLHKEGKCVIGLDGLDNLVEVEHINSEFLGALAIKLFKLGRIEFQMDEDDTGIVKSNNLQTILIDLDDSIGQNLFQGFDQNFEDGGLDSLNFKCIVCADV